jgi:acetyltransferase-like isoleucine patch superfamily enzyme
MNLRFLLKNYQHWLRRLLLPGGGGGRIRIGRHTYGAPLVRWWGEPADLTIGRYCSIADGVEIFLGGNHRVDWITTYPFPVFSRAWPEAKRIEGHPTTRGDVRIGHDVWLGSRCTIFSGVTIGHGAVVAGRAVVTRDVPDYAIVAGNPAVVVRRRFDASQVERLLRTAWWDWPPERVRQCLPLLLSGDVEAFLRDAPASPAVPRPTSR